MLLDIEMDIFLFGIVWIVINFRRNIWGGWGACTHGRDLCVLSLDVGFNVVF